jgi:hypothetical protein
MDRIRILTPTWTQSDEPPRQEVVQAKSGLQKKRAVAKALNTGIGWSYKQGSFKQQWDKFQESTANCQMGKLGVAAAGAGGERAGHIHRAAPPAAGANLITS